MTVPIHIVLAEALTITSGDKVLVSIPTVELNPAQTQEVVDRLREWAPEVDWFVVSGASAIKLDKAGAPGD